MIFYEIAKKSILQIKITAYFSLLALTVMTYFATLSGMLNKGAFTLANFARDFALSLHVLLNKNYLFYLLNMQASAKSRQCKCTFKVHLHLRISH